MTLDIAIGRPGDEWHGVRLTHPERVVYPQQGATKRDLAAYYSAVAGRMLPYIAGRPLSLVRCPRGRQGKCFYQKHHTEGFPSEFRTVSIKESDGAIRDYLYVTDAAGLVAGVQMGVLEFHVWGAKQENLEKPDRLVFDMDPDTSVDFTTVVEAALLVRVGLRKLGLESLPLVTGGKGVHVVAPLRRIADWSRVSRFARGFAEHLAGQFPKRFTATMSKRARRGRIFIDWLRNQRGSTAVAPYSTRARAGAPVAMPVSWKELKSLDSAAAFDIGAALQRLDEPDPWPEYAVLQQGVTRQRVAAFD